MAIAVFLAGMILSAGLLALILPVLRAALIAEVNARSDHRSPTPQGGGIVIVTATLALGLLAMALLHPGLAAPQIAFLLLLTIAAALGLADDLLALPVLPRLCAQIAISLAAMVTIVLPEAMKLTYLAFAIVMVLGSLALAWAMNAVNFVDGSDLITASHSVPGLVGFAMAFAFLGLQGWSLLAAALAGAIVGFIPFNRPPARLFLGDSGSLAIGFALGSLALLLMAKGHGVAAAAFIAYPACEATTTLAFRAISGRRLSQAHREHAYQRARDAGWSALKVAAGASLAQTISVAIGLFALRLGAEAMSPALAVALLAMITAVNGLLLIAFRRATKRKA